MINGISELEELEEKVENLKTQLEVAKQNIYDLKYDLDSSKSKISDLEEENEYLYGDILETITENFEGLLEYLDDNHLLTDELKNIIEFYMKFYIDN